MKDAMEYEELQLRFIYIYSPVIHDLVHCHTEEVAQHWSVE